MIVAVTFRTLTAVIETQCAPFHDSDRLSKHNASEMKDSISQAGVGSVLHGSSAGSLMQEIRANGMRQLLEGLS